VVDSNHTRIVRFYPDGTVERTWGSAGSGDGEFLRPLALALDRNGILYVTDAALHRVQKFDRYGTYLGRWGGEGTADGKFGIPKGIAVDEAFRVYVVDDNNLSGYPIDDDFDDQSVGTLPEGWTILYNGTGDTNQIIVDTLSHSAPHSFQLEGDSNWAANIYKTPPYLPDRTVVEAALYIEAAVSGHSGWMALYNKDVGDWGTRVGGLDYRDGHFYAYYNDGDSYDLGAFTPQRWYEVRIDYDLQARTYRIHIDGTLMEGTLEGNTTDTFPMHPSVDPLQLMLTAGNGDRVKVFYDDVRLYELGAKQEGERRIQVFDTNGTFLLSWKGDPAVEGNYTAPRGLGVCRIDAALRFGLSDADRLLTYRALQDDIDGDGIGDACDSDNNDGPLGDSDGDGILNKDDIYPEDGPDGDWDGDGIPNRDDDDDTDGPGLSEEERYHVQGYTDAGHRLRGKRVLDTQPYPDRGPCAGHGNGICDQGTDTPVLNPVEAPDPGPYPSLPDCPEGQTRLQGSNACIDL